MTMTLKAARVNKGLTIDQAAEELGVCRRTLINYECGKSFPDVPGIMKIEKLYGLSYNDIVWDV